MKLEYKNGDKLCTTITVDLGSKKVDIINFTDKPLDRAFGINEKPTYADFMEFVESRCFSRYADGQKLRLRQLGLDFYDPLNIISVTNGRMNEDNFTLTIIEE